VVLFVWRPIWYGSAPPSRSLSLPENAKQSGRGKQANKLRWWRRSGEKGKKREGQSEKKARKRKRKEKTTAALVETSVQLARREQSALRGSERASEGRGQKPERVTILPTNTPARQPSFLPSIHPCLHSGEWWRTQRCNEEERYTPPVIDLSISLSIYLSVLSSERSSDRPRFGGVAVE